VTAKVFARRPTRRLCYKIPMPNKIENWILFEYVGLELTPMSKPFNTKEQAEKERLNTLSGSGRRLGWESFGSQSRPARSDSDLEFVDC
jgi:hypothetical protein